LTISGGTGQSGESLNITAPQNDSGNVRTATITVRTVAGSLYRTITITQAIPPVTMRPTGVIESFERSGYVNSSTTPGAIRYENRLFSRAPIWNFVHIAGTANTFTIRNDTTGLYFTETSGGLGQQERITGTGLNSQRWIIVPHSSGSYAIRSVSNNNMYVTRAAQTLAGSDIALANRDTSNNNQLWNIGYIWHVSSNYDNMPDVGNIVAFWDGRIDIRVESIGTRPTGFNFYESMNVARSTWGNALDIAFRHVIDMEDANIRAYAGNRSRIQSRLRRTEPFPPRDFRFGVALMGDRSYVAPIQARGVTRHVNRLTGVGARGNTMAVFFDSGGGSIQDSQNVSFATMTSIHELGHALGYLGHSPRSGDVMIASIPVFSSPIMTLDPAEKEHLRQIYRDFRN